jgi:poly(A) polymerase
MNRHNSYQYRGAERRENPSNALIYATHNSAVANYLGVSPPVSYAPPTNAEITDNAIMELYMKSRKDIFDDDINLSRRMNTLQKLYNLVKEWVVNVGINKNINHEHLTDGAGVTLRIFGSQKLGVQSPDADIDVLCIAPSFVSRDEFFNLFCSSISNHDDVSMMFTIPEAFTPVAKFYLDGQAIDMIFVSLDSPKIPLHLNILDSVYLKGLDDAGIRSINGCRVAEKILRLVPNVHTFCLALRAIKHWAKVRAVYSNVLGFLGGVNFAILVAFVCQRYVNSNASTIVRKFFMIFSQWRWPNPVNLNHIEEHAEEGGRTLTVWNPKINIKDSTHRMPIITPAYPAMNSAYNVGLPQFRTLQEEIFRGQLIFQAHPVSAITNNSEQDAKLALWRELFALPDAEYFSRYPAYVQIDISSGSAEEQRSWFGWCESRLRMLIVALEQPPQMFCQPQANCYHRLIEESSPGENNLNGKTQSINHIKFNDHSSGGHQGLHSDGTTSMKFISSFFMGLSFRDGVIDIAPSAQDFLYRTNAWSGKQPSMCISVNTRLQNEVPSFVLQTVAAPSSTLRCTPSRTPLKFISESPLSPVSAFRNGSSGLTSPRGALVRDLFSQQAEHLTPPLNDTSFEVKFGTVDPSMLSTEEKADSTTKPASSSSGGRFVTFNDTVTVNEVEVSTLSTISEDLQQEESSPMTSSLDMRGMQVETRSPVSPMKRKEIPS